MDSITTIETFIQHIPKAELHLHIEGTLEPELMMKIAKRNEISLDYESVDEIKKAYQFSNLQDFLDIYYAGANVLRHETDFFDLTWSYLTKAHSQNIVHTEIFFDPQTHTERGVAFSTVITGIHKALEKAQNELGISSKIIMSILRHLDEDSALETLKEALPYKEWITAIGLDSSEVGNPPSKFARVFEKAKTEGFETVAHAGEEGDAGYVREAIEILKVSRIDHGNRSLEDELLIKHIVENKIPLTVCPLSNLKLKVVKEAIDHPLLKMLNRGMVATVNSDDPAYFGGYINENFLAMSEALNLTAKHVHQLSRNSFIASFLTQEEKSKWIRETDLYYEQYHGRIE
ncbi:adenosine deaminase [Microbacter margulisiae]|uniref:Adenine deaminase n=1 Tax=Microbacter margulisiae TaxID=1350067 RepID=A0A7W5DTM3_9PORP|nr:adenosine deaminase [Microbacter margulisiae]MBB3188686.1 adenosine deaminase [Microbacter margulisiae]